LKNRGIVLYWILKYSKGTLSHWYCYSIMCW